MLTEQRKKQQVTVTVGEIYSLLDGLKLLCEGLSAGGDMKNAHHGAKSLTAMLNEWLDRANQQTDNT